MKSVLKFLARLPLPLLYGLGTFAYVLTFYVLRWRRDVAERNLAAAFPEKTPAERYAIMRRNYRNLGETLAEMFWGFGATAEDMRDRVLFDNPELIARYVEQKVSVLLLTAHMCNWEWLLPAGGAQFGFPIDTVYKPIKVEALDEFVREARSRFGGKPIPMRSFLFELMRRAGQAHAYAMVADQTPLRRSGTPQNMRSDHVPLSFELPGNGEQRRNEIIGFSRCSCKRFFAHRRPSRAMRASIVHPSSNVGTHASFASAAVAPRFTPRPASRTSTCCGSTTSRPAARGSPPPASAHRAP